MSTNLNFLPQTPTTETTPGTKPSPSHHSSRLTSDNGTMLRKVKSSRLKKKWPKEHDDTPKAFLRLMAFQQGKKLPKALDDGVEMTSDRVQKSARKRKAESNCTNSMPPRATTSAAQDGLEIKPGESLSSFGARVDAALPLKGLKRKSHIDKMGQQISSLGALKNVGITRTEQRMQKMYAEWRKEEARLQEQRQEAIEVAEENNYLFAGFENWEQDMHQGARNQQQALQKKKKKKKKRKKIAAANDVEDNEEDLWRKMQRKNQEEQRGRGLHDVVLAPPKLVHLPTNKLKNGGGGRSIQMTIK